MIHFLNNAPREHRELLRTLLQSRDEDKGDKIRNLILPSRSIEYARDAARSHIARARAALVGLGESEAKGVLDIMAEFVITRGV